MLRALKQTSLVQRFKKTKLCVLLRNSYGDWRYPFMILAWKCAEMIVPRKKVSLEGVTFSLSCTNWVTHFRWYLFKKKEVEVQRYIDRYVREGDVFFDIGANVGIFSLYCGKRHDNVSIFCFEPEYSNLNVLRDNIICNGLTGKTKIYSVAIGDFVGLSDLHIQDFEPGSAVHTESKGALKRTDEGYDVVWTEGISVITLDEFCRQTGLIPNAIKIDTDGNEDKVLRGAKEILRHENLRSIIIEATEDPQRWKLCEDMLREAGFEAAWKQENTRNQIWARTKK